MIDTQGGLQVNGKAVSSIVSNARKRLGPASSEYLFRKLGGAWTACHVRFLYRKLSLFVIDDAVSNVSDYKKDLAYSGNQEARQATALIPKRLWWLGWT